jgi:exodeoxyribonuclease VII small subunit
MANETSFEQHLLRLEEIVKRLEKGDASLEESLKLFEEGTALVRGCTKQLDEAEQKVLRLVKGPDGSPLEQPFETDE